MYFFKLKIRKLKNLRRLRNLCIKMECKEFCFQMILNAYNFVCFVCFVYCFKKHTYIRHIYLNHEFYTFIFFMYISYRHYILYI